MPLRPVRLTDEAIDEARIAYGWYQERNPRAAAAFLRELDEAVEAISMAPEAWPPYLEGTRRKLFGRFPFGLVYRPRADFIQVIAVAHQSRRPAYWRDR